MVVGSILEKLVPARWKVGFAAHGEVGVDNVHEAVVRTIQNRASGEKTLGPARAPRLFACAGLEEAAAGSTLETPVRRFQKQASDEVAVGNAELLLTKSAVAAEVEVERDHNPEPLQWQYAVHAALPVSDPYPGTVGLQAHPHRSGSHLAGLLAEEGPPPVEGPGFHAGGSP